MATKPAGIDEYIKSFPKDIQKILQQVRVTIKKAAPAAEETIKYAIPTFILNGNLVHFAAYKAHIGFYPMPSGDESFKKAVAVYKTGKGSIQFPIDKAMPLSLITKMVKFRIKELGEKTKKKKALKNEYIKYHNNGTIWAKGKMSGNVADGYWEFFRKDGVIMRSGYFDRGKQTGEWTTYDKQGKVYKVTKMK